MRRFTNTELILQSGKLPITIPHKLEDNPSYLNFRSEGGRVLYGEDVYVGYRYYEKMGAQPLFPFGHGLSYSTFKLNNVEVEVDDEDQKQACVTVEVSNTSSRAGAEVVQVYVAPPPSLARRPGAVQRPVKELRGVAKVTLQAGETQRVSIEMETALMTSYWDERRSQWCSEAGEYTVLVGTSSAATPLAAPFTMSRTRYWKGLRP